MRACRGPIDTLARRRRPGHRGGAARRARSSPGSAPPPGARAASPRSAPGPSCSPRRACSTAAGPRPTGTPAPPCAAATPRSTVEPDPIFVRDGDVYTSAGVTGGHRPRPRAGRGGRRARRRAGGRPPARRVRPAPRRPGAVQRAARPSRRPRRPALRELQAWLPDHLDEDLTVETLAERAFMSPRNFARAFRREVGVTPAAYVAEPARRAGPAGARGGRRPGRGRRPPLRLRHRRDHAPQLPPPASHQPRRVPRPLPNPSGKEPDHGHRHPPVRPSSPRSTPSGPTRCSRACPARRCTSSAPTAPARRQTETGMLTILTERAARGLPPPRGRRRPRRLRHAHADERRGDAGVGPRGARDLDVDDVGVHRLPAARRRRAARRTAGDDALAGAGDPGASWAPSPSRSAWSRRARSSPRPACHRASTWR